jgi:hypothetical protein
VHDTAVVTALVGSHGWLFIENCESDAGMRFGEGATDTQANEPGPDDAHVIAHARA